MEEKDMKQQDETRANESEYIDEIVALVRSGADDAHLAKVLGDYHENDIALALPRLTHEERKRVFAVLGDDVTSEVLAYAEDAGDYLAELDADRAADLLEEMDADDAVDILENLDDSKRDEILGLIDPEAKEDIELIHSYGEDCFGSLMTTNFVTIERTMTVKQAMRALLDQAAENDNISTLYVLDADGTFYGAIDLKDLIIARQETELESLVVTSYPTVTDTDSVTENLERVRGYAEDSIPVLSTDKKLLGVVTAQSLADAVHSEIGEDYVRLAGVTDTEDLREPLAKSISKRLPWLLVLLVLGVGVSFVVGLFEGVVRQIAMIVCFQSLILDMAGNVGTQSLAVTIRIISDGTLNLGERLRLVLKEMRVGLVNGAILGAGSFLLVGLYIRFFKDAAWSFAFATSGCVGLALCVSMVISSLIGTVTPLFFKRIGVDPAVASGPLITTVNDLVAVCVYYGTAWILLIRVLNFAS